MKPIDILLKELAEADAGKQAPARVEARLLSAFRPRVPLYRRWWMLAAAAAAILVISTVWPARHVPKREVAVAPVVLPPAAAPPVREQPVKVAARRPKRAPRPMPAPVQQEEVTEFIPVTPGEPLAADETPRVVRVKLPAAALASFGFQVVEDRGLDKIQADVLLGQDGSARAIRLVNAAVYR